MRLYLMEQIDEIGLVLKEVEVISKPNSKVGSVVDGKCFGFTKEQCVRTFEEYVRQKVTQIQEKAQQDCQQYFKFQGELFEMLNQINAEQSKE